MIIMASDDVAFSEMVHCIESLVERDKIIVYDLGLGQVNLNWLIARGIYVKKCVLPSMSHKEWRKFVKPFILSDLPSGDYLYVDTDIIFSDRFRFEPRSFMAFKEWAPCRNPIELRVRSEDVDLFNVNSGYIYFKKPTDNGIIETWCKKTLELNSSGKLTLPHSYDQGVLQHVLETMQIPAVIGHEVDHNPVRDLLDGSIDPIAQIREYQDLALASHFAGSPKISHLRSVNHPRSIEGFKACKGMVRSLQLVIVADDPGHVRVALKKCSAWYNNYYRGDVKRLDTHADILITTNTDITKYEADVYVNFSDKDVTSLKDVITISPALTSDSIIPIIKQHVDIPFRSTCKPKFLKTVCELRSSVNYIYTPGRYL